MLFRSCGIDRAHLSRIFEPFFTTKPVGIGTGLGLAIADQIAHAHGGTIRAASTPGQGTTMAMELPLCPTTAVAPGGSS